MRALRRSFAVACSAAAFFVVLGAVGLVLMGVVLYLGWETSHMGAFGAYLPAAYVAPVGFCMAGFGGSVAWTVMSRYRAERALVRSDRSVEAEFTHVVPCGGNDVRVACMYFDERTGREYEFVSDVVRDRRDAFREGSRIRVYVDLENPNVYVVDV